MVYILYLDASGDPGQYRGKNTKYFVLAGMACQPETTYDCSKNLERLLNKYFPKPNPRPKKIRYYPCIHNKFPWNQINSKDFADELFGMIINADVTLFGMIIDKVELWRQYAYPANPYQLALSFMMESYQWFLERNDELGMVVSDRENTSLMKILLQHFENLKEMGTEYKKMENIIDTIFFSPSKTCANLQTVDFCAYSIFRKYERGIDDRFNQILLKFDPHGLKVFPE